MEHNQIIPTKPIQDDKLKKEIENFKFFVQYGNFKDINDYKNGDIPYNPNVPSYSEKGSSVGSKELEFTFVENKKENIYFSDSINFKPTE